ncbi:hypothetical protein BDQ12DRAFT_657855 [Crucibulum laeve]|uniref:Uncharacterized protein n=1 Tax=Crucibulum laeve TaxID=68775 RepID=A0A5C3LL37_9AGAR|nr:hypothetical protein BDQ12DRAFT_657855 [Crucibulum laeve]
MSRDSSASRQRGTKKNHHKSESRRYREELHVLEEERQALSESLRLVKSEMDAVERRAQEAEERLKRRSKELRDASDRNRELEMLLQKREDDLRRMDAQYTQTRQFLDTRTAELKGAQVFLSTADTVSGGELIVKLEALNSEIFQCAAYLAESFPYTKPEGERELRLSSGTERLKKVLGERLFMIIMNRWKTELDEVDPLPVQVALQFLIISWSAHIITAWSIDDPRFSTKMGDIYNKIRKSEEQAISGRWRAITNRKTRSSMSRSPGILDGLLSYILDLQLIAGWRVNEADKLASVGTLKERLTPIVKSVFEVKSAIGEGITSADMDPLIIPPGEPFNPTTMENAYEEHRQKISEEESRRGIIVGCTTEMGLRMAVMRKLTNGTLQPHSETILKPKIITEATLLEAVGAETRSL